MLYYKKAIFVTKRGTGREKSCGDNGRTRGGEAATTRYVSDFYRRKENRASQIFLKLPGTGMRADADYRIRVYPVSAFGVKWTPLEIVEHTWPGYPFKDGKSLYPQE